jgi:hypothetical protein
MVYATTRAASPTLMYSVLSEMVAHPHQDAIKIPALRSGVHDSNSIASIAAPGILVEWIPNGVWDKTRYYPDVLESIWWKTESKLWNSLYSKERRPPSWDIQFPETTDPWLSLRSIIPVDINASMRKRSLHIPGSVLEHQRSRSGVRYFFLFSVLATILPMGLIPNSRGGLDLHLRLSSRTVRYDISWTKHFDRKNNGSAMGRSCTETMPQRSVTRGDRIVTISRVSLTRRTIIDVIILTRT